MFDIHIHITPKNTDTQFVNLTLENYIEAAKKIGINHAYVCLNPFISGYMCNINHKHKVKIIEDRFPYYKVVCEECENTVYHGTDVYESANFELFSECETYNKNGSYDVKTLAFLSAAYKNINYLIDKYEECGDFIGYKFHPTICKQYVSSLPKLNTDKPILLHSGVGIFENPAEEIEFSKRHEGSVIIAHCCRFDRDSLLKAKQLKNVWVDTSPFSFLWNQYLHKKEKLYIDNMLFQSPSELFEYFLDLIGIESVIFSSDAPFGNLLTEINLLHDVGLSKSEIDTITKANPQRCFCKGLT